jgi:hypothetical protein
MKAGASQRPMVFPVGARDGVPVHADQDARALEPEPADTGAGGEDVGGVIQGVRHV